MFLSILSLPPTIPTHYPLLFPLSFYSTFDAQSLHSGTSALVSNNLYFSCFTKREKVAACSASKFARRSKCSGSRVCLEKSLISQAEGFTGWSASWKLFLPVRWGWSSCGVVAHNRLLLMPPFQGMERPSSP